jgi:hypothetical protein
LLNLKFKENHLLFQFETNMTARVALWNQLAIADMRRTEMSSSGGSWCAQVKQVKTTLKWSLMSNYSSLFHVFVTQQKMSAFCWKEIARGLGACTS